jgi:hypothetical protein
MKKTNTNAIVFVQASDNTKAVVATRNEKTAYLIHALKQANEPIYEALGGKRVVGLDHFRVEFPTVKNAKAFIAQAKCELSAEEYASLRKTEPKGDIITTPVCVDAPAKGKGKKAEFKTVTDEDGNTYTVAVSALEGKKANKKAPRKSKGDKPTTAPNAKAKKTEPKAEKVAPKKAKGNAELTDAQKKRLDICKMSILNRAASAYSIANGGEATNFKALGKTEKDLAQYIPNAKAGLLKSNKWAKAVELGITEDMLGF